MKALILVFLSLVLTINSWSQPTLTEADKKTWRYKALYMVELSPPFLQNNASGERYMCVRVTNHLPFDIKEVWFHFQYQDEVISPKYRDDDWESRHIDGVNGPGGGDHDWLMQNIAAGESRVLWIRPRLHIRGDTGETVVQTMVVPAIDLCAYWPVKKKEDDPWKCVSVTEESKKSWRYKALSMVEISPPFLQKDTSGKQFLCVRVFNHLPYIIKEAWFHFENGDESIRPKDGNTGWQMQNIAAGETCILMLQPKQHLRGDPGESIIQSMVVPDIDLDAHWPVR